MRICVMYRDSYQEYVRSCHTLWQSKWISKMTLCLIKKPQMYQKKWVAQPSQISLNYTDSFRLKFTVNSGWINLTWPTESSRHIRVVCQGGGMRGRDGRSLSTQPPGKWLRTHSSTAAWEEAGKALDRGTQSCHSSCLPLLVSWQL